MASDIRRIYVYDDFSSSEPLLAGCLYVTFLRGSENCAFEYDKLWLRRMAPAVSLDPELMPFPGRQYPSGKTMFGVFSDAAPNRWGRVLMNKRERIRAERESRKPRKLYDSDYLIGVYDETRMGGLRFKEEPDGPFLSDDRDNVDETDNHIRIELAISVAERFGITKKEAEDIACDIRKTVADRWRDLAKSCGLSRGQIEAMAPAFMTYIKGQT